MTRLVAVAVLALAIGFGARDVLPRSAAPAAAQAVPEGGQAQVTLNAPGLL